MSPDSLKDVPARVRAHMYLFWVGMTVSGLGVIGFFLSFSQIASPAQASIDVHTDVPMLAYASIFGWLVGLIVMWYARRRVDVAVQERLKETQAGMFVDDLSVDAPDGREQ